MLSANQDIKLEQGARWEQLISISPSEYSLVGKTVYCKIVGQDTTIEMTESNGKITVDRIAGTITLILTTQETSSFTNKRQYKLEILENGEVDRVLRGYIIPILDVTWT